MIKLAVGDKFEDQFLDTLISWNQEFEDKVQVTELYGSIRGLPTARSEDRIPSVTRGFIEAYVKKALDAGIRHKWTLNQSCIGRLEDFQSTYPILRDTIVFLEAIGVNKFIVTVPLIAESIKSDYPDAEIEVSTIARIRTSSEIARWHELGATSMCGEIDLNRCYKDVRSLNSYCRRLGMTYWVISNEFCLRGCIHRPVCYNLSSHSSTRDLYGAYPFGRCDIIRHTRPEEWIKASTIIPQFMNRYTELTNVDHFKITGRTAPTEVILPIVRSYMEQEHKGNLTDLWPSITSLSGTPDYSVNIPMDKVANFLMENDWSKCAMMCGRGCTRCLDAYEEAVGGRKYILAPPIGKHDAKLLSRDKY